MRPQRALLKEAERPKEIAPEITHVERKKQTFREYLTGGFQRMANGEEKTLSSIPFPVFAWLMMITIGLVFTGATIIAKQDAMQSTMLMRDAQLTREIEERDKRNAEERQKLEQRIAEQQAYINQFRVELARTGRGK